MSNEALSIKEVRTRFNKEKPRFVALKNQEGQFEVRFNSPKIKPERRMQEIEAHLAKQSTPDGLYFFITSDNRLPGSPERVTPVAKGNVSKIQLQDALPAKQPTKVDYHKTEDVWDVKTALDILTERNQLRYENEQLRKYIAELEAELKQLNEKSPDDEEPKESMNGFMDGINKLVETLAPTIDRHFDLKEKQISAVKERNELIRSVSGRQVRTAADGRRSDGGVPAEDPEYEQYFALVVEKGTEQEFNYELDYLEQADPDLYTQLCEKYDIDTEEETQEEDDGQTT